MARKKRITASITASLILFALVVIAAQQHSPERSSASFSSFSDDAPTGALGRGERLATQPITQPQLSASSGKTVASSPAFIQAPQENLPQEPEFAKGSILVKFKAGFAPDSVMHKVPSEFQFTQSKRLYQDRHQDSILRDTYELVIPETVDPRLAAAEYKKQKEVEYAEPNFIYETSQISPGPPAMRAQPLVLPDDPFFSQQWHLPKVSADRAWGIERGSPATVIAVIDTGVRWNHPDLQQNIWSNPGEISNNGIDDDGNGFVDDKIGWDFVETTYPCWPGEDCLIEDNNPDDFYGHGTHIAGIVGAVTDNGIGVAGVCWFCTIMPVRAGFAYDGGAPFPDGLLEVDDIAEAITYAADNGARIISMSFGAESNSFTIRNAVAYAYSQGVVLVAAAGNYGNDSPFFPAAYSNVLAVAATDQNDNKAGFSNFGSWIDTAAPGVNILSTVVPGVVWGCSDALGGYGYCSGTSMSTPIVSGIIGLALSKIPALTQDQIFTLVHSAYDPVFGSYFIGAGRINAFRAVQPTTVSLALLDDSLDQTYISTGTNLDIHGTASGQNFFKYRLDFGGPGVYPSTWVTIQGDTFAAVVNGSLAAWNPSSLNIAGVYTIRLQVTDTNQKIWEDRKQVRIDTTILPGWPKQIPGATYISESAIKDVNNDSKDEIFFYAPSNTYGTFNAVDGNGLSLPGWPIIINQPGYNEASPAVANIDSDTRFEAVYGKHIYGSPIIKYFIYEHIGSSQPGWPINLSVNGAELYRTSPVIAEIIGNSNQQIVLVTQESSNSSGPGNKLYVYDQNGQLVSGWPRQLDGIPYSTPAVGDIDANGDMEIVVSTFVSSSNMLYIFNHDGTNYSGWPLALSDNTIITSPVLADIDNNDNGKLEIIQGGGLFDDKVYAFNHDGTLVPNFPFNEGSLSYSPAIGDIDSNGDLEIVFGNGNAVYALNHDGTIFPGWPYDDLGGGVVGSPIIVDLDGNGIKEILIAAYSTKKLIGLNADGTLIANFPKPLLSRAMTAPAAGDLDGDGLVDVFLTDFDGNMYRWEFGPITPTSLQWPMFHHDPQHTGRYP